MFVGFVCFVSAAAIALVLLADTLYSRPDVRRRLAVAHTPHQARQEDLLTTSAAASALPPELRPRLWLVALFGVLIGVACLLLAA